MTSEYRKMSENKGFVVVEHIDKLRNDYEEMRNEVRLLKQEFTHLEKLSSEGLRSAQHAYYHWRVTRALIFLLVLLLCALVQDRVNMSYRVTSDGKDAGGPESNPFLIVTLFVGVPLLTQTLLSLFLNSPLDLNQAAQDPSDKPKRSTDDLSSSSAEDPTAPIDTADSSESSDVKDKDASKKTECETLTADKCVVTDHAEDKSDH